MLADKSEPLVEPGIIIPYVLGEHLFNSLSISAFHSDDDLKIKQCLTVLIFTFGRISCRLVDL